MKHYKIVEVGKDYIVNEEGNRISVPYNFRVHPHYPYHVVTDAGKIFTVSKKKLSIVKSKVTEKRTCKYPQTCLIRDDGNKSMKLLHILVWESFNVEKPYRGKNGEIMDIDHINNDKNDYRLSNLNLVSRSFNIKKTHVCKKFGVEGKYVYDLLQRWDEYVEKLNAGYAIFSDELNEKDISILKYLGINVDKIEKYAYDETTDNGEDD